MMEVEIKGNKIKAPLKGKDIWLPFSQEEEIRQKYICRLVNTYGFTLKQMSQDYDYTHLTKEKVRSYIVIWKNENELIGKQTPLIFVECKSDSIVIRPEDYFKGIEISKQLGAVFFVATNTKQTKIYTKVFKISDKRNAFELINIPNNEQAQDDSLVKQFLLQTNDFAREEFSRSLTKCHNIIRNNDKLSPEAAFDEISKILFIKTLYERANKDGNIFTKKIYNNQKKSFLELALSNKQLYYQELFENVKNELVDDDLFEPTEIIRVRENSFEAIVEELETYNLSTTSDDVKGIAFEQFLGKTFRGELGQFFTPRTIVDFIVDVLDPMESETICDPCCGSGGFLIKAFEYVRAKIENEIHLAKEKIKADFYGENYFRLAEKEKIEIDQKVNGLFAKLNTELDLNNPNSRIRELSYECIFGTDANPRMSRTAKMNMIMHGDGHGGVHHNDGLLNINGIFESRFDVILTNPPFGSRVDKSLKITEADKYLNTERIEKYRKRYGPAYDDALRQINENIDKPILNLYETGSMSSLTEVLFIERCLNLLKPGGRMGIVLPEGVLNNVNLQKVRDYVESRAKILLIVSIPQDVFIASGATVKPSLIFFKKFTEKEKAQYEEIVIKSQLEMNAKYEARIKLINERLSNSGKGLVNKEEKKRAQLELKQLNETIAIEIKGKVKEYFNYQIPVAEVEKAGISSTGAQIENDLKPLAQEFKAYRESVELWSKYTKKINYQMSNDEVSRVRIKDNIISKPEIFYS